MKKLRTSELNRSTIDEFKAAKKFPLVVVLDNVRSLNNVGSAFRTCDAFAVEKLVLCGITGTPPHRDIQKTAIGAQDSVEWVHETDTATAVTNLKRAGYTIIALEQTNESKPLNTFKPKPNEKYCIIVGNEVFGVEDDVLSKCDTCLEIPQFGTKHSLNVSVSLGVTLWHFVLHLME